MKLDLKRITAICIDGRPYDKERHERYVIIFRYMLDQIEFHSIKFMGSYNPEIEGVEHIPTGIFGLFEYSKICILILTNYIDSDYCLIFQDDGFIVNPDLWSDKFYDYDYIGAPWPLYLNWPTEGNQVGNGGFSLRSKKLLDLTKTFTNHFTENEDTFIVNNRRHILIEKGMKIADLDIARKFAVERPLDDTHNINTCFGFHGNDKIGIAVNKIKN